MSGAAPGRPARRSDLEGVLVTAAPDVPAGAMVWLVGDTGQLWEGWLDLVPVLHLAADDPAARSALAAASDQLGLALVVESPAEVIPLPDGSGARHRPVAGPVRGLWHFDPYSAAFRCLARGDEPDYRTVLRYLRHGWMTVEAMDGLLDDVLPRFTQETIAQDPAEFRRKYRGLKQMWRAGKQ